MGTKSRLKGSTGSFNQMMNNGFGVVTVMNVQVYETNELNIDFSTKTATQIVQEMESKTPLCTLDTLKISNITVEGPTKTVTGGQYNNTLIKFGKTARIEMQDALGTQGALDNLCGTVSEYEEDGSEIKTFDTMHVGSDFNSTKTFVGDTFFIDKESGEQVEVKIIFYQVNPDSIFNLTQEADGDATVFDLNGDLLMTDIKVATNTKTTTTHGVFYSIVDEAAIKNSSSN